MIALARKGVRLFWTVSERTTPRLRFIEAGPVALLVAVTIAMTLQAGPLMSYMEAAAAALRAPATYIDAVRAGPGRGLQ
jgi:multicomponent K+:H+ antiporter subunit D